MNIDTRALIGTRLLAQPLAQRQVANHHFEETIRLAGGIPPLSLGCGNLREDRLNPNATAGSKWVWKPSESGRHSFKTWQKVVVPPASSSSADHSIASTAAIPPPTAGQSQMEDIIEISDESAASIAVVNTLSTNAGQPLPDTQAQAQSQQVALPPPLPNTQLQHENFVPPLQTSPHPDTYYTDNEYETHLKNQNWTRKETDLLLLTVWRFNGRWPVVLDCFLDELVELNEQQEVPEIGDSQAVININSVSDVVMETAAEPRQQALGENHQDASVSSVIISNQDSASILPPPPPPAHSLIKSMEDIKARYYQVKRVIFNARQDPVRSAQFSFDTVKETSIRHNLRNLLGRSAEMKREEEILFQELQKYMPNADIASLLLSTSDRQRFPSTTKWSVERDLLYKQISYNAEAALAVSKKTSNLKKKGGVGPVSTGRGRKEDGPSSGLASGLVKSTIDALAGTVTYSSSIGRLPQQPSSRQTKIQNIILEFGIPLAPTIPCKAILEVWESVVAAATGLFEARKHRDRITGDILQAKTFRRNYEADLRAGRTVNLASVGSSMKKRSGDGSFGTREPKRSRN